MGSRVPVPGKVGVVSGGGFGHIPVFAGYVGDGLLDACAVGDVFASPDMNPMLESIQFADQGKGVLCVVGNYGGDRMNFDMACEMAEMDDIDARKVIVSDDVAAAGPEEAEKRRGVAGFVFVTKVAGAAAAAGQSLDEVEAITQREAGNVRSVGVALPSCTVPQAGKPTFEIADDEMEIGMGIHGEPGVRRGKLRPFDEVTDEMIDMLLADKPASAGSRIALLVNGLGATPVEELYLVFRQAKARLEGTGAKIAMHMVGNYATSMEMAGASVTILHLDDELETSSESLGRLPFLESLKMTLTTNTLRLGNDKITARIDTIGTEMNALDGQLGDGDLGVTLVNGFNNLEKIKGDLPSDVGMALFAMAKAVTAVSGSSFGTLLATALMASGKITKGNASVEWS